MTEKKSSNPFINMANDAKKNVVIKQPPQKTVKPSKGFGGPAIVRRTGRGR